MKILYILSIIFLIGSFQSTLLAQTAEITKNYIWDSIKKSNSDYTDFQYDNAHSLVLYRVQYLDTIQERIDLRKTDHVFEYIGSTTSNTNSNYQLVANHINNQKCGGNAYWVFSASAEIDKGNTCIQPRIIVHDEDTARRLAKALNHLATINPDPFD